MMVTAETSGETKAESTINIVNIDRPKTARQAQLTNAFLWELHAETERREIQDGRRMVLHGQEKEGMP